MTVRKCTQNVFWESCWCKTLMKKIRGCCKAHLRKSICDSLLTGLGWGVMISLHVAHRLCWCVLYDRRNKQHCLFGLRNVDAVFPVIWELNFKIIFELIVDIIGLTTLNLQSVLPKGQ
jgi:hypothetical protein